EPGGDPRKEVLADRRGGADHHLHVLLLDDGGGGGGVGVGQVVREGGALDGHHVDPVFGQRRRDRLRPLAADQADALTAGEAGELLAGGHADEGGLGEFAVEMLGDDEDVAHGQITFASLWRTFTSSSTDPTFRPPERLGGVSSFLSVTRGFTSAPRSATGISFSSFLRAFMMPGSEA